MKYILLFSLVLIVYSFPTHCDTLVYGYDDSFLDGWTMRTSGGSTQPEIPPAFSSNAPSQGTGCMLAGVQSNKNYTIAHSVDNFQYYETWEDYDTIAFDVRVDAPQGWNSFALVCRSDLAWSYTVASRQIDASVSGQWVTISGPVTDELTNYFYGSMWCYLEYTFNQAEINSTGISIDNFRLINENDQITNGITIYNFDTPDLDGWESWGRGIVSWTNDMPLSGAGYMQIDITGAVGNWANAARKPLAEDDAAWDKNDELLVWFRAPTNWGDNVTPQLVLVTGSTNMRMFANESDGHITCDDEWHPYTYSYNSNLFQAGESIDWIWEVTVDDSPSGHVLCVDNIRLLPGNEATPDTNLLHIGSSVYSFDTGIDGWQSTVRSVVDQETTFTALGAGAMRVEVTNAIGNWANAAVRADAFYDDWWEFNTNCVIWFAASPSLWHSTLSPQLTFVMDDTNITVLPHGAPTITIDGEWHGYQYIYDPDIFTNTISFDLSLEIAVSGGDTPTGGVLFVDNIRLVPGVVPEPAFLLLFYSGITALLKIRKYKNRYDG